jgi:hypothetical protein
VSLGSKPVIYLVLEQDRICSETESARAVLQATLYIGQPTSNISS